MRLAIVFLALLPAFSGEPGYVNPSQCQTCHRAIYDSYQQTGMGRSFQIARDIPALTEFVHRASNRIYSVVRRDGMPYLRRSLLSGGGVIEKQIDFVIGSGNHSKTFVHRAPDGRLFELPVSWYSERGGYWAMSPGYDRADHSDMRREVSDTCLFCHNGYPSQANGGLAMGIDCQRCHGPGEAHVTSAGKILNPRSLNRVGKMEVCMQCHLESASRSLPDAVRRFGRSIYAYRPGEPLPEYKLFFAFAQPYNNDGGRITVNNSAYGLLQSKCFERSAAMTCTTCHDPHSAVRGDAATQRYTAICRSCHKTAHEPKTSGCIGCHMQKRRTEDAVHVVMTDHSIRRKPLAGDLVAPLVERHDRQTGPIRALYPSRLPNTPESRLHLAVARIRSSSNVSSDILALEHAIKAAQPSSPEPYVVLAEAYKTTGRKQDAIRAYRACIEKGSSSAADFIALGDLLLEASELKQATDTLERAAKAMPTEASLWNSLSVIYARAGRFEDAMTAVSKALAIDRDDPSAWLNMGVCLHARKDKKGAEAAYRQALLLQPDLIKARDYLKLVLEDKF